MPGVSGDRVVWDCADTAQIFTWKAGVTAQLSTGSDDHEDPMVSGDRVVWDSMDTDGNYTFFTWKSGDAASTELDPGSSTSLYAPQVSGDRVAWVGQDDGGVCQVYTWKAGDADPTQLSNDVADDGPVAVSGDRVVWAAPADGAFQIFTEKVGVDSSPVQLTSGAVDHVYPAVSGDRVLWSTDDGTHFTVFTQEVGEASPTQLTNSADDLFTPQLSGDRVVWAQSDGTNDQILTMKVGVDASPVQLTSDAHAHGEPAVSGDRVVWDVDNAGTGSANQVFSEVVGVDASAQMLGSSTEVGDVQVSGGRVAWWGQTGSYSQIFTAVPVSVQVSYTAANGGSISGAASQTITYGGSGTPVTAVPATGYHFVSWSDGDATAARTEAHAISGGVFTATFALNTYHLTYLAESGGVLSGAASQSVTYGGAGTAVVAVPMTGSHFVGWSDGISTASRTDRAVAGDVSVTAYFAPNAAGSHTLVYSAGTGGSIQGVVRQTVADGGSGSAVTALADTGYTFVTWSDGILAATRTDSGVTKDTVASAVFAPRTRQVHYVAGPNGIISGDASQTIAYAGTGTAVTAVPLAGYHFVRWSDGVTTAGRSDVYALDDATVSATFARDPIPTRLTITSNVTTVLKRHAVALSGTVSSGLPKNTKVVVYARKPGSAVWVKLAARSTTSAHRWTFAYAPSTKGTWYFEVTFPGSATYAAAVSSSRKVTVR
jgi:hypothetical protein